MRKFFLLFILVSVIPNFFVLAHYNSDNDLISSAFNQTTTSFGIEAFPYSYKEPSFMKHKGDFYGLNGSISYELSKWFFIQPELRFAKGTTSYSSPLVGNWKREIPNSLFEARFLFKKMFCFSDLSNIVPFIGIGYRYKEDSSAHLKTSTDLIGYARESTYYYLPIGFNIEHSFSTNWGISILCEYDLFLWGKQKSYLSQTHVHHQNKGFGARSEFLLVKIFDNYKLEAGPFFNYWSIGKSKISYFLDPISKVVRIGWEPKNNTKEIGIKFKISI